jgi:proliferating cell nuclear antigen
MSISMLVHQVSYSLISKRFTGKKPKLINGAQLPKRFTQISLGMSLQAMDGSHVALVSLNLSMEGFEHYRADTNMVLGVNVNLLAKVMKLADPADSITLSADDKATHLKLVFENPKTERTTEFTMNLIQLDNEHLAIPETEYSSVVSINSSEFTKICKELYSLNETMTIHTT